jgi:hypothetical protein
MVKQKAPFNYEKPRAISQFVSVVKVSVGIVELAKGLLYGT